MLIERGLYVLRTNGWREAARRTVRLTADWMTLKEGPSSRPRPLPLEFVTEFAPFDFPAVNSPKASIVIPVHNKAVYTYNCLRSVHQNTNLTDYEVIVVDDASTDGTAEMLASVGNLRVVSTKENLGFLRACNLGAQAARAEYLVLLNNDTLVANGWLEALLRVLDEDPLVGICGGKLIYPDGRLQEAGSIIWRDGSGWNYGRLQSPDAPEFSYLREVDYCSGACIAVRRSLWTEVGGFDLRFAPAYFEDVDLAFAARAIGYKVIYQPACEVVHFEGVSHGTDVNAGLKRAQVVNQSTFVDKWRESLRQQYDHPKEAIPIRARQRNVRATALVIDHYVPARDQDAGSLRMFHILRLLRELGCAVTFLPQNLLGPEPYTSELRSLGIEVLCDIGDPIRALVARAPFDFALVSRPQVAREYLRPLRARRIAGKVFYDTVDLHFLREQRRAEVEGSREAARESARLRALELSLMRDADLTIVVTEGERDLLQEEQRGLKVAVLPTIHPIAQGRASFDAREGLLFVGNFMHPPNRDALCYFDEQILRTVRRDLGNVPFFVVGPSLPDDLQQRTSITYVGWVPDVEAYFQAARVFVAPLRYGAGQSGKIGQSLALGLPVVTSSLGASGLGLAHDRNVLIADAPGEFAAQVVRLYSEPALWERLSRAGQAHVYNCFSPEAARGMLREILQEQGVL